MVLTLVWIAAVSLTGASITAVSTGVTPTALSAGTMSFVQRRGVLGLTDEDADLAVERTGWP